MWKALEAKDAEFQGIEKRVGESRKEYLGKDPRETKSLIDDLIGEMAELERKVQAVEDQSTFENIAEDENIFLNKIVKLKYEDGTLKVHAHEYVNRWAPRDFKEPALTFMFNTFEIWYVIFYALLCIS